MAGNRSGNPKPASFSVETFLLHCATETLFWTANFIKGDDTLNSELVKQAMERIINPNILVNLVSRRVRQLSTGGGGLSSPLLESEKPLGSADTALEEIIQEKIDFEDIKEEND